MLIPKKELMLTMFMLGIDAADGVGVDADADAMILLVVMMLITFSCVL